jgi:hypothetical protein
MTRGPYSSRGPPGHKSKNTAESRIFIYYPKKFEGVFLGGKGGPSDQEKSNPHPESNARCGGGKIPKPPPFGAVRPSLIYEIHFLKYQGREDQNNMPWQFSVRSHRTDLEGGFREEMKEECSRYFP